MLYGVSQVETTMNLTTGRILEEKNTFLEITNRDLIEGGRPMVLITAYTEIRRCNLALNALIVSL